MSAPNPTIEVTLKSVGNDDDFPERKLLLGPNTRIPIGRSSKSAHKNLFATVDNLYIDSPVISREHAVLSSDTSLGIPEVYIKDKGSMHGTTVNQMLLPSDREHKLNNGDTVQFGADVMRDTDSFFAKKYRFESRLLPVKAKTPLPSGPLFPTSFTVPDTTSSDEEEDAEDETKSMSSPSRPGYGSQTNPVNVDDYEDDVPAEFLDFDEEEDKDDLEVEAEEEPLRGRGAGGKCLVTTNKTEEEAAAEKPKEKSLSPERPSIITFQPTPAVPAKEPEPLSKRDISPEAQNSDEEEDVYPDLPRRAESVMSSLVDDDSEDSMEAHMSEDDSDVASNDGSEHSDDSGVKEDLDTIRRLKMEEMLKHAQEKHVDVCRSSSTMHASSSQASPVVIAQARPSSPPAIFGYKPYPEPEKSYSARAIEAEKTMFDLFSEGPYSDSVIPASPAPPRPTAPAQLAWAVPPSAIPGTASDFGQLHHHNPWFDDSSSLHGHSTYSLPGPSEGFHSFNRTETFSSPNYFPSPRPYMVHIPALFPENKDNTPAKPEESQVKRLQTPEEPKRRGFPTPPTAVQEERTASSPPTRRTKVSIPEIVEDNSEEQHEQPPTPTSMKGLKRKADAVEDTEVTDTALSAAMESLVPEAAVTTEVAAPAVTNAVSSATERPKKRLRTALANAGYLATGIAIGAVGAFGALLALPDSYLQ
ncbi:hypothetical protein BCR34DRAFT_316310 [Clohesyomyces aquaticus]|uniref:FHA domain-containing protein n=1 Tax=Clohesyomyces aquaticus TaxID=1231657 RepID=A0A1Y1ZN62_9PLEO|nr:hypothetical protein BCR34DRAFT_316310 [Clohesyomyces aquaticus]